MMMNSETPRCRHRQRPKTRSVMMITALVSILLVWQRQQQQQRQGHHPDVLLVESFVLVPSYRCDRKLDLSRSAASRMSTRPRRRRVARTTRWNSSSSMPKEKTEVESKSPEAVPAVQTIDRDIWSVDHNQQQQQLEEKMLMAHQQLEILNKNHNHGHHPDISISMSPPPPSSSSSSGVSGAAAAALSITSVAASTSIALAALSETSWTNDDNPKTFANHDESLAVINDINTLDGTATNALSTTLDDNKTDDADVWRARLLLIGAAALYGTNFSLVKLLGDTMPVGISTTFRFGLAALATSPFLFSKTMSKSSDENTGTSVQVASDSNDDDIWKVLWLGFEVGLWNSIGYVAQAVGLETTLASKSAFICSMAVVVVPLLDYMAGKKLLPRQWVGAIMALVGVAFLELGGADDGGLMMNGGGIGQLISAGDALSLVQPFVFGIGFWKMEKAMHEYPTEAPRLTAAQLLAVFFSSVMYALWTLTDGGDFGALSTAVAALPLKEWLTDPAILFSIFWTGCITTALTIYMETLALETLSAAETTLIFSTEPLWGTAFAAVVMGEQLQLNAGFGAAFILAACIYSNLGLDGLKGLTNGGGGGRKMELPKFPSKIPSWLTSTLAGGLATWSVASKRLPTQEVNDVVDDLMETLVNKWP